MLFVTAVINGVFVFSWSARMEEPGFETNNDLVSPVPDPVVRRPTSESSWFPVDNNILYIGILHIGTRSRSLRRHISVTQKSQQCCKYNSVGRSHKSQHE